MCKMSPTIGNIATSLVKFNGEVETISKDAKNPHFKNTYASLDNIVEEIRPLLFKHGITVMQIPSGDGETVSMKTMLLHESGEWMESEPLCMKPVKNDPQGVGSCITYARRYSLCSMLNLSTGDDDDGNDASHPQKGAQSASSKQPSKTAQTESQTQNGQSGQPASLISEAQIKYAHKLKHDKGISDDDFKRIVSEHGAESIKDLSKSAASQFINLLTNYVA